MAKNRLQRELNFKILLFLTINSIIGTGIFFLPALGAKVSGVSSIIAWAIGSVCAIFTSMYFAELVSMFPKAGGVYEFSKQAFGKFQSFLVGWLSWIIANITISMLIVGSIQYAFPAAGILYKIISSLALVFLFNYISYRGLNLSTLMLLIFGIITMGVLLSLIIPGLPNIELSLFQPFLTHPASLIFLSILIIIETFFGWETTTFLAEETKNPRKVMPKALIISTVIVVILTMSIVFVSLGLIHWSEFRYSEAPLSDVAMKLFGPNGALAIKVATFFAIIGGAASWIVTTPRLLMAISRDKLFPKFCESIHPKHKTPHKAILLQTVITSILILIGFGSYEMLLHLLLPLVLIMYSVIMLSVVVLRYKQPSTRRYFKAPFGIVGPILLIIFNLSLIVSWAIIEHEAIPIISMGFLFILTGIPFYMGIRLTYDKRFREKFFDIFSYTWDKLFPIWYGKDEQYMIMDNLDIKEGDTVLDYGCYTGMTTKKLSDKVGDEGLIVSVDVSKMDLELTKRKIDNKENVLLIKENEEIPFKKSTFDGITLVSVLDHFEKPLEELKKLRSMLKRGKSISVLSFGKVFYLPSPDHLKNESEVKKLFQKAGFKKIKITKKQKLLSEYYFIKAVK